MAKRLSGNTRGLSPRVRGKPIVSSDLCRCSRSIPACAGETVIFGFRERLFAVYPRVCGGNLGLADEYHIDKGLSPRVRGKHGRDPAY